MKKISSRIAKLTVLLIAVLFSFTVLQNAAAQNAVATPASIEKVPFLYSIASTWEGNGIVRYRIAVQVAESTVVEGLKIVASNPVKGNVSIVTAGASASEDKVFLAVEKTTPGKNPMLEYVLMTNATEPRAVMPVSAEIFWKQDGKNLSVKTEIASDDYDGFVGGENSAINKYDRIPNSPKFYPAGRDLGVLKGSWYEMGVQYGERSGPEMLAFFDYRFSEQLKRYGTAERLLDDVKRYEAQTKLFSPEFLEFARGIGDGANKYYSQSKYHADISNYYKVVFLVNDNCMNSRPGPIQSASAEQVLSIDDAYDPTMYSCTATAFLGSKGATSDGTTFLTHNNDGDFNFEGWKYTYIAVPTEGNAFWGTTTPGKILDITGANNQGLALASTAGPNRTWVPEENIFERAFGVSMQSVLFKMLTAAKSVPEAIEIATIGTPEYRQATGRKTLLRTRHSNYILVDKNEAAVVEVTANRYAVRRPGDFGEEPGFIVVANHFVVNNHSYNDQNERTTFPMTTFGDDAYRPTSASRYFTAFWQAKMNYGKITTDNIWRILLTSHAYITKKGELVEKISNGKEWIPAHLAMGTVCSHAAGYPEKYLGNTTDSKVITVDFNQVRFSQGRPCEYVGMPRIFNLGQKY